MRIENGSYVKKNENMSYNDYKNKVAMKKKQSVMMFISIFLVLLLIFLGFARIMSPDVDISLGDDSKKIMTEEDDNFHGGIDRRLKELQMEDEMQTSAQDDQTEEDGLVKIPKRDDTSINSQMEDSIVNQPDTLKEQTKHEDQPQPQQNVIQNTQHETPVPQQQNPPVVTKTYRVYVGMYSTKSQAEVARGILSEAGLGVSPTIKQVSGGFTLQAGAFSKKESADNLSHTLLINNYPARVVSD